MIIIITKYFKKIEIISLILFSFSCGKSLFKEADKKKPAEEAVKYLEKREPTKAIEIILNALGSDIENIYKNMSEREVLDVTSDFTNELDFLLNTLQMKEALSLISILSSAHAQLFKIDPFDIALALAAKPSESSGEKNAITLLYPVLPEASEANKKGLNEAIAILNSIPSSEQTNADLFKKALFLTANMSLITKSLDKDLDGKISVSEAIQLEVSDADELISILSNAILAFGGTENTSDSEKANATKKIEEIKSQIAAKDGADNTEKLREYLSTVEE